MVVSYPFLRFHIPSRSLVQAALAYVRQGLPVFPLQSQGKQPLTRHGFCDATTDERQIVSWWRCWPDANIGIPTGQPSGWVVLDIDPPHGGLDSLARLLRSLAPCSRTLPDLLLTSRCQRTGGGGWHLVFQWDPSHPLRNATRLAGYPGLDLRGAGGYIVVAPSRHRSGSCYAWLNDGPPLPFPEALVSLIRPRQQASTIPSSPAGMQTPLCTAQRRRDPAGWLAFVLARVQIGNRHDQALFLACRLLQEAALSPAQAEAWMRAYMERVPQSEAQPYLASDALDCLAWAARHLL
jgi:hypothetical protein